MKSRTFLADLIQLQSQSEYRLVFFSCGYLVSYPWQWPLPNDREADDTPIAPLPSHMQSRLASAEPSAVGASEVKRPTAAKRLN